MSEIFNSGIDDYEHIYITQYAFLLHVCVQAWTTTYCTLTSLVFRQFHVLPFADDVGMFWCLLNDLRSYEQPRKSP